MNKEKSGKFAGQCNFKVGQLGSLWAQPYLGASWTTVGFTLHAAPLGSLFSSLYQAG